MTSPVLLQGVRSQFVVALFTDGDGNSTSGGRIELDYYPKFDDTTTSTTAPSTTDDPFPESSVCGEILEGLSGRISYKLNETYSSWERCLWIVRVREASSITFRLVESGLSTDTNDYVHISGFSHVLTELDNDPRIMDKIQLKHDGTPVRVNGSVAIIHFATDSQYHGTGFVLEFEGNYDDNQPSSIGTSAILQGSNGSLTHPYVNNELSIFLFEPPNAVFDPAIAYQFSINSAGAGDAIEPRCKDSIRLFFFDLYTTGFVFEEMVCNEQLNPDYVHARSSKVVIMVFISDGSVTANGINIDWTWS
ncbi:uncharacterized protein LOC110845619 [Folsomia candida]|nr:uncharacterized protein LOC110845619 [Folsomia candida]